MADESGGEVSTAKDLLKHVGKGWASDDMEVEMRSAYSLGVDKIEFAVLFVIGLVGLLLSSLEVIHGKAI